MNISLDRTAIKPTRAHDEDAGMDLYSPYATYISPHSSNTINTGVHVQIPAGYCGILISKSGLNVNYDITSTGLIDAGYTGAIVVKLYNHGTHPKFINRGDKISQLVIVPCVTPNIDVVEKISGGARGNNGFGSTGV